jgi:hypothetical protein
MASFKSPSPWVAGMLALSLSATVQAKPHHHALAAPKPDPKEEEIRELKAENAALSQRLSAVEAAQAQTAATAQQAQAQAQQVAAAQAANANQIKRIPGEVETAVSAKVPKPVTGWWNNSSIGGSAFADLTNINEKLDGVKPAGSPNGVNVDLKRFYLIFDHRFNSVFSANITTDFTYDSGPAASTQLFIKKAYLQAKLADAFTLRLGSAELPWIPFVESVYPYRYVENMLIDRTKFGTTTDWGVHAFGSVPVGMVKVSYALSGINGMGFKKPGFIGGVNRSQDMDFEGRVSAQVGDFVAGVGGYDGKLGKAVEGTATYNNATRFDALVAYTGKRFRIGGEYFETHAWNDVTLAPPGIANRAVGWSGFGAINLTDKVVVFGRYDWVKPKDTTTPALKNDYFNVGIQYEPVKIVDLALVYKRDAIDNGAFTDSNFSTLSTTKQGIYDEVGLWTQYRW